MDLIADPVAGGTPPLNLLKHNRRYEDVGRNAVAAAEPSVVHFGGFQTGEVLQQTVRLINVSDTATRFQVLTPDSNAFKVSHKRGSGSVPPGLHEQLVVQFSSGELRYHYDCIRVHTEAGGLLIPIHAYPTVNTVSLPKCLDLGKVAIGETVTKQLQLACNVSLDFDFKVTIMKHNKCFTVEPLAGTVPAHGSAAITIAFTPLTLSTEELQLEVLLSEYNAQPIPITVTGSAAPNVIRDNMLYTAAADLTAIQQHRQTQQLQQTGSSSNSPSRRAIGSPTKSRSGSSGQLPRGTMQRNTLLPAMTTRQQQQGQELVVDGTYFPASLSTQHDINSVLNQQPGKLRTKDIKAAIATRKLEIQLEQQQLEAVLAAGTAAGVDPFGQPDIQPAIKEALFQLQLQQAETAAKRCTGLVGSQGSAVLGQDPPSPDTVKRMQAARQAVMQQHEQEQQEAATHRLELELQKCSALHVLSGPPPSSGASSSTPTAPGTPEQPPTTSSTGHQEGYPGLQGFKPQWLLLESNEWRKRVQVTQRFVDAVRVVIYRNRAKKRLQKLKLLGARLRGNKEALAGVAVQEVVLESSVVRRPGIDPAQLLRPEKVRLAELPVYRAANFPQHGEVEQGTYGDFALLQQQSHKAEFEWKLLGYSPEEYPGLIPYLPPCKDQPLMTGASEELPGGVACGVLPGGLTEQELEAMPEGLMMGPHTCLAIGDRYTNDQVFAPLSPAWGMDADALLQPRVYEYHDSAAQEQPGSSGVRALAAAPLRAYSWLPKQDPWQAIPFTVPELMTGPDPADAFTAAAEDLDKPQVPIVVPKTHKYLPGHAGPADITNSAPLVRQQKQQQLDASSPQRHQMEAVQKLQSGLAAYNDLLERPHRAAVKL